jgi:hypothetical protein
MHRLYILVAALAVLGAAMMAHTGDASAQRKKQVKPPLSPRVIERDRFFGPPQQPEPKYYGPAPGIQPPMERVPLPAPLAQPPINR